MTSDATTPDRFPVRVVVIALGLVLVGSVAAITFLAFTQTPIPDALTQLSIGSLTGTTALLARTQPATTTPVVVTNTPSDPVPTSATEPTVTPSGDDEGGAFDV
jgi:hypothetical protein